MGEQDESHLEGGEEEKTGGGEEEKSGIVGEGESQSSERLQHGTRTRGIKLTTIPPAFSGE